MQLDYFAQKCEEIQRSSGNDQRDLIVEVLRESSPEDAEIFVRFLLGERYDDPEKKTGVGSARAIDAAAQAAGIPSSIVKTAVDNKGSYEEGVEAAFEAEGFGGGQAAFGDDYTLEDVYEEIKRLPEASGAKQKIRIIQGLFTNCDTPKQAKWVGYCVMNDLSFGVGSRTVRAAASLAYDEVRADIDRAYALLGSMPVVIRHLAEGKELPTYAIPGKPFSPQLATSDEPKGDWMAQPKFDGARVLIHSDGEEIRIFTRNMKEVTQSLPEVVEALSTEFSFVIDGEAVAYTHDWEALPFENIMKRFRRERNIEQMREEILVRAFIFDIVVWEDEDVGNDDFNHRDEFLHQQAIHHIVQGDIVVDTDWEDVSAVPVIGNGIVHTTPISDDIQEMYVRALELGHEGVIVKDPKAKYHLGERDSSWRKMKPSDTIDVKVSGFNYGTGENADRLGSLDIKTSDDEEIGSVGIGFGDEFRDNTEPNDILGRIIEVEAEELQDDGVRFPRFQRVRYDKDEADSLARIRSVLNG